MNIIMEFNCTQMFLHTAWIVFSLSSSSLEPDNAVLTIVAGGGAAGLGHVGLVEGGEAGEVALIILRSKQWAAMC